MKNKQQLIEALNKTLADTIDLKLQAKQAHWNVKGENFISLHELFDKVAEEVDEYADMLAERVKQLGGMAEGTLQTVIKTSSLKAYPVHIESSQEHVSALAVAIHVVCAHIAQLVDMATAENDVATADLGTEIIRGLDKLHWFVASHVK